MNIVLEQLNKIKLAIFSINIQDKFIFEKSSYEHLQLWLHRENLDFLKEFP